MRHRNRIFFLLAIAVLSLIIASCTPRSEVPVIKSFTADETTITAGADVTLSWSINGAASAEITPGVGSVSSTTGSTTVTPTATTTYELRARNAHGSVTRKVTVTVVPPVGPVVTAVRVSPAEATVSVGDTRSFTAAVEGSGDFDDSVTWSSSNPEVATIDDEGVATALSAGSTTITATSAQTPAVTDTAELTVVTGPVEPEVTSVTVTPEDASLIVGATREFAAEVTGNGTFDDSVTWSSSATGVATVDATTGLVTAVAVGTATITATSVQSPAVTGTATVEVTAVPVVTSVTVEPITATVPVGETRQLTALVDGTGAFDPSVAWTSSDDGIATVDQTGLVTGIAQGTATITATSNQTASASGSAAITVPGSIVSACTDPDELVTFPDFLVDREVRALFGLDATGPITCSDVQRDIPSVIENDQETANALIINRDGSDVKVTSLAGIQHLIHLKRLELEANNLDDIGLLAGLTELTELNLDRNNITDLTPLAGLTNLRVLGFYANQVEELEPLTGLADLEILYASYNRIHVVTPLSGLVNLEHLWLYQNCRTGGGDASTGDCLQDISSLNGLANLRTLLITNNEISDIGAVSGMTALELLHANGNDIRSISALSALEHLQTVRLIDNPVDDLTPLGNNTNFADGAPFEFHRGTVNVPFTSEPAYHNLDLGYNCLLDNEAANITAVTNITARSATVDGEDNLQNIRSECGVQADDGDAEGAALFLQQLQDQMRDAR